MFIRRDGAPATRYTFFRVALFFFAAGLWLVGVRQESDLITGIAMVVAAAALMFSLALRRFGEENDRDDAADLDWAERDEEDQG